MRIGQVRGFVLALPEVIERPHFQLASFRVRGKIIATIPPGEKFLHVFVSDEDRDLALAMEPGFIEKLYWGERAAGVRIVLAKAKPGVVKRLLVKAWIRKAPKSLHNQI